MKLKTERLGFLLGHEKLDFHDILETQWFAVVALGMNAGPAHLGTKIRIHHRKAE